MILIDEIIDEDVKQKLEGISVVNGYLNNVSVLPGYLVHYAHDLMDGKNGVTFPAVSFEPIEDDPQTDGAKTKSKTTYLMKVVGAVSVQDRELVNQNINSLLFDVRRALAMDKFSSSSKALSLEIGKATFNLPDSKDSYAFFEMTITIIYVEVWK